MARIPVSEIPNAPHLPGAPPVAPYGQVPGAKFATQPYVKGHMQPTTTIANFEKYAADLQQKPLPGGFAEGAAMVSAAAGRYASSAGEGTARAAESISNSLNSIGSVFTDIANKANQTRDATDLLRYNDFKDITQTAFENQMLKEKVPVEQWSERWQTEGADRFMATVEKYGTTPATRSKIQADAVGFAQKQGLHYQNNVLKKSLQDDKDYLSASYEEAAKKRDAAGMRTAATELHAQNFENEGQYKLKLAEADHVQHNATIDFVRERNPKELRDQAIAARDGKASGEFKFLNEDPALAAQTSVVAAQEVNTRQAEKFTDFSNRILNRDVRMTPEQIESEGRAVGLDEADIIKLKKQTELEPAWNSQAVAEANDAVVKYDARADVDSKTKNPSIEGYKAVLDEINTKVPKEYRKPLLEELNRKRSEYLQGKKQDPMEARRSDYYNDLKKKVDDGLLGDTGLDKDGKLKDDPKSIQQNADLFKKKTQIQNDIDALFEKSKEEKWSVPKMDEEYRNLLSPHMSTQAGQAIYRKAVPELPPVTPEEQKAPPIPQRVPGSIPPKMPLPATPGTAPTAVPPPTTGAQRLKEISATPTAPGPANVARVSNVLEGRLAGKEDVFQAAANKHGVDAALLMAIAQHETGRGTSDPLVNKNNPGGMMDPKTDWSETKKFASLDEGIDAMARNLKEKYIDQGLRTIAQIQGKYAPINAKNDPQGLNKDWVPGVTAFYEQIKGRAAPIATSSRAAPVAITKLDQRSTGNIATLVAPMQPLATDFIAKAKAWAQSKGLDVVVTEGLRSLERQKELYAQGRTKPGPIVTRAKPGQSNHGTGRAMDVAIIKNGKVVEDKALFAELGKIGKASGLRWGGEFKSIYDPEHFELPG